MLGQMPSVADFQSRRVSNPETSQIIKQPLFDHLLYPAAGTQLLAFFQSAVGAGLTTALGATAGQTKTPQDTNMALGGQLASGVEFMIQSIELSFYPGSVSTTNTYTIDALTFFLAAASAVPTAQVDDVNVFYQGGLLELFILNAPFLVDAPLMKFPPAVSLGIDGAIASNSATTAEVGFAVANPRGPIYTLDPEISIQSAMNFAVNLRWPAAVALTSGFNARVGCTLSGYQLRASQ